MEFTQPAFTCSKLTIETLEQGVKYVNKYVKVNKANRTTPDVALVSLLLTTYFTPCFNVSIVNFEHVIAGWVQEFTILFNNNQKFKRTICSSAILKTKTIDREFP